MGLFLALGLESQQNLLNESHAIEAVYYQYLFDSVKSKYLSQAQKSKGLLNDKWYELKRVYFNITKKELIS